MAREPRTTWFLVAACVGQAALLSETTVIRTAQAQDELADALAHNPSLAGPRPSPAFQKHSTEAKEPPRNSLGFLFRRFAFATGLGGGGLVLPDAVHARQMIGGTAAGQIDMRVAFPYAPFLDFGLASGHVEDRGGSFREVACFAGGECAPYDSSISAVMPFVKTGLLQRLVVPQGSNTWQVTFVGGVGYRGLKMTREIENCTDCTSQHLDLKGGYFVSPELDLSYAWLDPRLDVALGLKLDYEHYLSGDIRSAVWVSAFVECM